MSNDEFQRGPDGSGDAGTVVGRDPGTLQDVLA